MSAKARAKKPAARRAPVEPRETVPLYPIRFQPILRDTVWGGGDGLRKATGIKVGRHTGEILTLANLGRNVSVVANGRWKGEKFSDLLKKHRRALLGDDGAIRHRDHFPVMIKFLCAKERLSLQVHPGDEFAGRYEVERTGKMEAWYVVHAPKDSCVARGVLPGITVAEFRAALEAGRLADCLNQMEISEGDVIFIPPGTVHCAWGGVAVLEVQQNSDLTYRLTDWGRHGLDGRLRDLHVQKALAVTDFYTMGVTKFKPQRLGGFAYKRKLLLKCEKFTMEMLELEGRPAREPTGDGRFRVMVVLRGCGAFRFGPRKRQREPFAPGQTFFVPAHIGDFETAPRGKAEIVCVYV